MVRSFLVSSLLFFFLFLSVCLSVCLPLSLSLSFSLSTRYFCLISLSINKWFVWLVSENGDCARPARDNWKKMKRRKQIERVIEQRKRQQYNRYFCSVVIAAAIYPTLCRKVDRFLTSPEARFPWNRDSAGIFLNFIRHERIRDEERICRK